MLVLLLVKPPALPAPSGQCLPLLLALLSPLRLAPSPLCLQ